MSTGDIQESFSKAFERQNHAMEVEALCRQYGGGFVIDVAHAYLDRKEREAAAEHQRWRNEMLATIGAKP